MTNTQLVILIAVLVIIYWYWQQKQPTLKSADEPPKFNSDGDQTIEKPEVIWEYKPEVEFPEAQDQPTYQLPSDTSVPDPTSGLKTYETTFEPTTTPLSRKQKRQQKKKFRYD